MRYFQEPDLNEMNPFFPCGKCGLKVRNNHKAIQCDNCIFWTHIKCDGIDNSLYENLKESSSKYFCKICLELALPFQHLNNEQFYLCQKGLPYDDCSFQLLPTHNADEINKCLNKMDSFI